jgi:hypothetical protein
MTAESALRKDVKEHRTPQHSNAQLSRLLVGTLAVEKLCRVI